MKSLENKKILITGGASGIGYLIVKMAAQERAHVIIFDVVQKKLDEVSKELASHGYSISTYYCDVSNKEMIYEKAKKVQDEIGDIDILINNAGVVQGKFFADYSDQEIQKTIEINTIAHFWLLKAFLPSMIQRNQGHIVTLSSAAGTVGVSKLSIYCATKFAVFGFNESLRQEFRIKNLNIKTTVVCPYYINTGMFAGVKTRFPLLLPILKQEKVAKKIIQGIKKEKEQIVMPFIVKVTWVFRILPIKIFDWISSFLGVNASMDDFAGKGKK